MLFAKAGRYIPAAGGRPAADMLGLFVLQLAVLLSKLFQQCCLGCEVSGVFVTICMQHFSLTAALCCAP